MATIKKTAPKAKLTTTKTASKAAKPKAAAKPAPKPKAKVKADKPAKIDPGVPTTVKQSVEDYMREVYNRDYPAVVMVPQANQFGQMGPFTRVLYPALVDKLVSAGYEKVPDPLNPGKEKLQKATRVMYEAGFRKLCVRVIKGNELNGEGIIWEEPVAGNFEFLKFGEHIRFTGGSVTAPAKFTGRVSNGR